MRMKETPALELPYPRVKHQILTTPRKTIQDSPVQLAEVASSLPVEVDDCGDARRATRTWANVGVRLAALTPGAQYCATSRK
jgi:hypothetical protein